MFEKYTVAYIENWVENGPKLADGPFWADIKVFEHSFVAEFIKQFSIVDFVIPKIIFTILIKT